MFHLLKINLDMAVDPSLISRPALAVASTTGQEALGPGSIDGTGAVLAAAKLARNMAVKLSFGHTISQGNDTLFSLYHYHDTHKPKHNRL